MSCRLCCYKQQQLFKLLAQFVFKVSALCFNTRMRTCVSLHDCRINDALILFIVSCQVLYVNAVSKVGKFSNSACSVISCLVMGIFMPKTA